MIEVAHPFTEICAGIGAILIMLSGFALMCQRGRSAGTLIMYAVGIIAFPIVLASLPLMVLVIIALLLFLALWKSLRSLLKGWK